MGGRWQIELFGGLRVAGGDRAITRFQTRQTGFLLAYLACSLHRVHPRQELIDLLWPEAEPEDGRHRLSQALSSLRHALEPPGVERGAVLLADRAAVQLNPAAVCTDVAEFENALLIVRRRESRVERSEALARAVELYNGPLLAGYDEAWVLQERERLAECYF